MNYVLMRDQDPPKKQLKEKVTGERVLHNLKDE